MELRCQYSLQWGGYEFFLRDAEPFLIGTDPQWKIAKPIEFEPYERGTPSAPAFRLEQHEAQALIDELWQCGLRPTQGKQSEGQFADQSMDLDDIRTRSFAKLNLAKPGNP